MCIRDSYYYYYYYYYYFYYYYYYCYYYQIHQQPNRLCVFTSSTEVAYIILRIYSLVILHGFLKWLSGLSGPDDTSFGVVAGRTGVVWMLPEGQGR